MLTDGADGGGCRGAGRCLLWSSVARPWASPQPADKS